jgi:hypothetical protein
MNNAFLPRGSQDGGVKGTPLPGDPPTIFGYPLFEPGTTKEDLEKSLMMPNPNSLPSLGILGFKNNFPETFDSVPQAGKDLLNWIGSGGTSGKTDAARAEGLGVAAGFNSLVFPQWLADP